MRALPLFLGSLSGLAFILLARPPEEESPSFSRAALQADANAAASGASRWTRPPPPTELGRDMEQIERAHKNRKAWAAAMHRAPPEVDWKAIERENGMRATRVRAAGHRGAEATKWVERGSENQAGRMHAARPSTDGTQLYAGSSLGGLWRGTVDGAGWTPIGDNLYGGVQSLVVLPGDVLLAATDNGMVHRSTDSGATWLEPTGIGSNSSVRRMISTSDGSAVVFAVVGSRSRYRLVRSTDAGQSFSQVYDLEGNAGDVWVPRNGGSSVYLVAGATMLRSDDAGDTWTTIGDTETGATTAELTCSEAGAPRCWSVQWQANTPNLYRSDDAGASWTFLMEAEDYWNKLAASIINADTFLYGGMETHRTRDAGDTFTRINRWDQYYDRPEDRLHADIMGIDVVPDGAGGETWYIGTDGGTYRSRDTLETVENLSLRGLRVSQYYTTLTSKNDIEDVAAGAQDQGYQLSAGIEQTSEVYDFEQVISGDYAHLTSWDGTLNRVISVYPGVILIQDGAEDPVLTWADFPMGEVELWLPPVVADPVDADVFYYGGEKLYRYTPGGREWEYAVHSDTVFSADRGESISALAFSRLETDRMWVATSRGRVFWSVDRGVTFTASEVDAPAGNYWYGQALLPSRTDPDTIWIGGSGYGNPSVLKSTDGGRTWEDWSQGLPDTLVYALAEAPDGSGRIFAGTETAAFQRDPGGEWYDITLGAPITIYWSAEALIPENTIRFGTYGRGIWDYQLDADGTGCYPVVDRDGDGAGCDEDCDDATTAVAPGATEICGDGVDQDCDGLDTECDGTTTTPTEPPPEEEHKSEKAEAPGGCGCGTAAGAPMSLTAAVGLLALRRKRHPR